MRHDVIAHSIYIVTSNHRAICATPFPSIQLLLLFFSLVNLIILLTIFNFERWGGKLIATYMNFYFSHFKMENEMRTPINEFIYVSKSAAALNQNRIKYAGVNTEFRSKRVKFHACCRIWHRVRSTTKWKIYTHSKWCDSRIWISNPMNDSSASNENFQINPSALRRTGMRK